MSKAAVLVIDGVEEVECLTPRQRLCPLSVHSTF